MPMGSGTYEDQGPEALVAHLVHRLRNHRLWDLLLIFLPPLIAALHCVTILYRSGRITEPAFIIVVAAAAVTALGFVLFRYHSAKPSVPAAARLLDERAVGGDRFLTISTIEPQHWPPSLISRVRTEAARLVGRVRLNRDFPYRIKQNFYRSLLISAILALLFDLGLQWSASYFDRRSPAERLHEIAREMTQRPNLAELARRLENIAEKAQQPKIPPHEMQSVVRDAENKIQEQQKQEQDKETQQLLTDAAGALKSLEQQSGAGDQKTEQQAGGGVQSNLPQQGSGEGKSKEGGTGNDKGTSAQLGQSENQGNTTQMSTAEQPKDQQKAGGGKGDQPDPGKSGAEQAQNQQQQLQGKTQAERPGQYDKDKRSEEIPQGAAPAERFNKPGEGNQGLKGAGYVTVQLPEEVGADSKNGSTGSQNGKGNRIGGKLPVSNVPLPPDIPDAPAEKQQIPLEYRGLIR